MSTRVPLQSIRLETVFCPFCEEDDPLPITGPVKDSETQFEPWDPGASQTFRMVECNVCGTVFLRQRPRTEEIGRLYSNLYHCYEDYQNRGMIMNFLSELVLRQKIKLIEKHFPGSNTTLLDYGCGSGTWLTMLRNRRSSWRLIGTDIVPEQIERLRASSVEAYVADESNVAQYVEPGSVGVIHLFHVIEHVPSPLRMLESLADLLAPGGVIIGQTPNHKCLEQRIFKDMWWQWHFPRHTVIFSPETMRAHAEKAGLEVVKLGNSLSAATQWSASALKYYKLRKGKRFLGTREPLYPLLVLASVPISLFQVALGLPTSHLDFVLRKPDRKQ